MSENGTEVVKGNAFERYFLGPLTFFEENTAQRRVRLYSVRFGGRLSYS